MRGFSIGGGGQPYPPAGYHILDRELLKLRAKALYEIDERKELRKSHENPFIERLYQDYLGEIGGHLAHELLHTTYSPKEPRGIK